MGRPRPLSAGSLGAAAAPRERAAGGPGGIVADAARRETDGARAQGSSGPPAKPPSPRRMPSAIAVRLPPRQAPGYSPLTTEAANFMNAYWANAGGSSDQVLPYLSSIYAPLVDYYGKPATRESILKEKFNFIRRWPMRQTWLPPGEAGPRISCDDATAECEISGVRDFDAVSPERGARSIGLVHYTYRVRFADGSPRIVAEDSKVVSRE